MMPIRRNRSGRPISDQQAAMQAWQLAVGQMMEAGHQALSSGAALASIQDDDVKIAQSPSRCVYQIDKVRVLRYEPLVEPRTDLPPILICYGLFGRQTMIDLQEDRSLVRNLLAAGLRVYVVDWGNPTRADQFLTLDDYIDHYLHSCVDFVMGENGGKPISVFGICEGGTFAAALAAHRPQMFASLALAIAPIDFHGDAENFWAGEGFLNTWIGNLTREDVDQIVDTYGMLPGKMTGAIFSALTPITSMTKYNLGLAALGDDRPALKNFLRMEKWISDRPDHPREAARQWLNDLYRENALVAGTFRLSGRPVDLRNISCPVLNIFALQDHIIPVSCSKALGEFVPQERYDEIGFPGGHVGVFVSGKAQGVVAGGLVKWLVEHHGQEG